MDPTKFITLLSTPRLVRDLQPVLLSFRPHLQVDGFFGPATGKAMGELYCQNALSPEWENQIPDYEDMYALQLIIACHYPLKCDGYFGPDTGEKLGKLIINGDHIPYQRTNEDAIAILKELEGNGKPGKPFQAYICPTGVPTIGWGSTHDVTMHDVRVGKTITEQEAQEKLDADLAVFENAVRSRLNHPIGSNMFSACVLLTYNIGAGGFASSTVLRKTNSRNYQAAATAFEMWDKGDLDGDGDLEVVPGLAKRRKIERELFERDL